MKRSMTVWGFCAIVAILTCIAGCGGSGDGGPGTGGAPALVGNWQMTSMSINSGLPFSPAVIGWDLQLQVRGDGSLGATETWAGSTEPSSGGWSVSGSQLHLTTGSYNWTGTYSASAGSFTLSNVQDYDGEGHTGSFVFSRR